MAPPTTEIYTLSLHDALPISHLQPRARRGVARGADLLGQEQQGIRHPPQRATDRKSTRLNSSHRCISYAVFCLKKKKHASSEHGAHAAGPDVAKTRESPHPGV